MVRHATVKKVPPPTQDAIRAHMDAILTSSGFANSDRISRFLRFTVEMKLRGEEDQVKEYLLGQEVFDRGADFDPRMDPIVRVEARRLRQRLAEFYDGPGRTEPIRIAFPKGSYAPVIEVAPAGQALNPNRRRWMIAAGAGLLAGGIGYGVYSFAERRAADLAVIPARWVWNGNEGLDESDEALAEAITAQLANQGRTGVIGWPVMVRWRGTAARDVRILGRELGVAEVAVVSVRRAGGEMRVTVFLLETASGQKRLVRDYFAASLADSKAQDRVAGEIAAALAAR